MNKKQNYMSLILKSKIEMTKPSMDGRSKARQAVGILYSMLSTAMNVKRKGKETKLILFQPDSLTSVFTSVGCKRP